MSSNSSMHIRTVVLPGPKIEVAVEGLMIGQSVDVSVQPAGTVNAAEAAPRGSTSARRSILEVIEQAPPAFS